MAVAQPFVLAVAVVVAGSEHELAVHQIDMGQVLTALAVGVLHGGSPRVPGTCANNDQIPADVDEGVDVAVLHESGRGVFGCHSGRKSVVSGIQGDSGIAPHDGY